MNQGQTSRDGAYHQPVLANEVVELMAPVIPGVVVDATFGGGGHSRRLLAEFGDDVKIIAIDRDPEALANARGYGRDGGGGELQPGPRADRTRP